jgi:hypothetical protein
MAAAFCKENCISAVCPAILIALFVPMTPSPANSFSVAQQRSLRIRHVLELFSGLILLGFSGVFAWKNPSAETYLWAATVWLGTLIASAFSVRNWKSLWAANLKCVTEFTDHYRQRCAAELRAARFGLWFLAVQLAITVPWLTLDYLRKELTGRCLAVSLLVLALQTAGFIALFRNMRRRALQELESLREMQCEP